MTFPEGTGWEFRLSTDGRVIAFYDPGNAPWFIPQPDMQGRFVDSCAIDRYAELRGVDWVRFLPQEEAAREVLEVIADWASGHPDAAELLERQLKRRGYSLPEKEDE